MLSSDLRAAVKSSGRLHGTLVGVRAVTALQEGCAVWRGQGTPGDPSLVPLVPPGPVQPCWVGFWMYPELPWRVTPGSVSLLRGRCNGKYHWCSLTFWNLQ